MNFDEEVYSFALFELGCESLEQVYKMSWREFQLRSFGFNRSEIRDLNKVRVIAYNSKFPVFGMKGKPPSLERFMPIEGDKQTSGVSETHKELFIKEMQKYVNEQQAKLQHRSGNSGT